MKKAIFFIISILLLILPSILFAQKRDIIVDDSGKVEYTDERFAIVIGIDNYENLPGLNYAVKDAKAIADILEKKGNFTVHRFFNEEAYKTNIYNSIEEAKNRKTVVFYYGGHGVEKETSSSYSNKENYLALGSTDTSNIENTSLKLSEIKSKFTTTKKIMFFIDACRTSGKSIDGGSFSSIDDSEGLSIFYSTSENQYSYESEKLEHGIYTYFLLKALNGEADKKYKADKNGYVSFKEVVDYVKKEMRKWLKKYAPSSYKQVPIDYHLNKTGKFHITKAKIKWFPLGIGVFATSDINGAQLPYSEWSIYGISLGIITSYYNTFGINLNIISLNSKNTVGININLFSFKNNINGGFNFSIINNSNILAGINIIGFSVHNSSYGLVLSILNINHENFYGLFGGGININGKTIGLQLSGFNLSEETYGGQLFLINISTKNTSGFQFGLINTSGETYGAQLFFINVSTKKMNGFQLGFTNYSNEFNGAQFGAINVCNGMSKGFQLGLFNSGIKNGLQIGLINVGIDFKGLQIGLLNFIIDSDPETLPFMIIFNSNFG